MGSIPFQYTPLDKKKTEIRLLEIIPQVNSSLKYSLATFNLKTSPPYIALSYTWGNDEPSHTIVVNGRVFKVRDNLSYVLPRLAELQRDAGQPVFRRDERYFWIDAICIDQQDTKERNHQVSIMADIFTTASLTIAWLGPEDEHFRIVTTVNLGDLQKSRDSREKHAEEMSDQRGLLEALGNGGEDDLNHPLDSPTPHDAAFGQAFNEDEEKLWHQVKSCLEKIACMEYFTRMWIIQEILLSRELWVMCGNRLCTWRALEECWLRCFGIWQKDRDDLPLPVSKFMGGVLKEARNPTGPLHSVMASRLLRNERTFRLDVLVHLYHDRKCKDPLDRIYALLGLLPPKALQLGPIPVDYDISPEDLFKLARKHIHLHAETRQIRSRLRTPVDWTNDLARSLQIALGVDPIFRIQCESQLIREGFFRDPIDVRALQGDAVEG